MVLLIANNICRTLVCFEIEPNVFSCIFAFLSRQSFSFLPFCVHFPAYDDNYCQVVHEIAYLFQIKSIQFLFYAWFFVDFIHSAFSIINHELEMKIRARNKKAYFHWNLGVASKSLTIDYHIKITFDSSCLVLYMKERIGTIFVQNLATVYFILSNENC